MKIILNGTVTMHCNLLTDIKIAKETGYAGVEIIGKKLYRYLDRGMSIDMLMEYLGDFPVLATGFIQDIERQEPGEFKALIEETEKMCSLAEKLNCPNVQLLTGPLYKDSDYKFPYSVNEKELLKLTARNLKAISKIGEKYKVSFYFEPLNWAPLHRLDQALEVINMVQRDNIGLLLDFWHLWCTGTKPEDISKLDKNLINSIHICDSLDSQGERSPDYTQPSREVWTGAGRIPIKEWVDAVISTGYDGW